MHSTNALTHCLFVFLPYTLSFFPLLLSFSPSLLLSFLKLFYSPDTGDRFTTTPLSHQTPPCRSNRFGSQ